MASIATVETLLAKLEAGNAVVEKLLAKLEAVNEEIAAENAHIAARITAMERRLGLGQRLHAVSSGDEEAGSGA